MSQTSRHDSTGRYGSRYGSAGDRGTTNGRASRSCPVCQAALIANRPIECDALIQKNVRSREVTLVVGQVRKGA